MYSKLGYCLMYFIRTYVCNSCTGKSNFNFLFNTVFHSLNVVDNCSVVQEFYDGCFQVSLLVFFYPPGFLKSETLPQALNMTQKLRLLGGGVYCRSFMLVKKGSYYFLDKKEVCPFLKLESHYFFHKSKTQSTSQSDYQTYQS